tara:strand:+ start:95266 stop:98532 length:3267 start_codon:yes stop_codon:yes gene_type:complete
MRYNLVPYILIFSALFSCQKKKGELFENPDAKTTGINFINQLTETKDQNILDYLYFYNGGGVSIGDINNDGLADIYFTGNQVENKLYLNKGNFVFEDMTEKAGVAGSNSWSTGSTMADVNGDGNLDIYVSAVVGINGFLGHNELFINNGDLTFTESAEKFGLNLENYSSQAAFFDADNDGDLDVYILNHAIHTVDSFGPASIRNKRSEESGDKLMINENGKFVDHSEQAGIYGGANSYGLGISTADFNNDGFTDIYISNDFHEDDYYYLNNGDGTFTESLGKNFGHTSRFSMGSDVADINNDGYYDLMTLDMLAEDEKVLKSSAGDDNVDLHKMRIERLGYHPQYTRNMLQLNESGSYFEETGLMSGVAASDWSWGALFGDYDRDGIQDIFISNGIPKRPNDLDYIRYTSNEQIRQKLDQTHLIDQEALKQMPSGAVVNYTYKGKAGGMFENQTKNWAVQDTTISTGAAYGDLDNDGDLDIVTNNINSTPTVYKNINASGNYLNLKLKAKGKNTQALGAKAILYTDKGRQYRQLYTTKGWQSSSQAIISFGFPQETKLDSLIIIWPDQTFETLKSPEANRTVEITPKTNRDTIDYQKLFPNRSKHWFTKVEGNLGIDFVHKENNFTDFNMQKLIPHQLSDNDPAVSVGDLNDDGTEDIFFGSSRYQKSKIYYQTNGSFESAIPQNIAQDSLTEETSSTIADFNNDGIKDILVTSGGGESVGKSELLLDRLYLGQKDGSFKRDSLFVETYGNASIIRSVDYDNDGDLDVFIGVDAVNYNYGAMPESFLLQNKNGKFSKVQEDLTSKLGMITDAVWDDYDNDGDLDLVTVGEWTAPKFLQNDNGKFTDVSANLLSEKLNGMWQTILPFDIDADGDTDYILGNWGLNTKLNASAENPLVMYYDDFDNNGITETLIAKEKNGKYYFLYGLDELASQLNFLKKKFTTYKDFAGKDVEEIMGQEMLDKATKLEIHTLASGYLQNDNGDFHFKNFDSQLQLSPLRSLLAFDFNNDGKEEVLIGGNYFGITPYHGKFDSFAGAIMTNSGEILDANTIGLNFAQKAVKNLSIIKILQQPSLLATFNNDSAELYKLNF